MGHPLPTVRLGTGSLQRAAASLTIASGSDERAEHSAVEDIVGQDTAGEDTAATPVPA